MTGFPLRIPEDLKERATAQAEAAGVSLNQYIAIALASRVGAQAEAERYFAARAGRTERGRGKAILAKAGKRAKPRRGDERDPERR
jgi:hypothetical protein